MGDKFSRDRLGLLSLFFSLSIFFCYILANSISFDFIELAWRSEQIFIILLYYLILGFPFFFSGLIISSAVTQYTEIINKIYFSDLLGAGTGTILSLFLFLIKGDTGAIIILSILPLSAAILFSTKKNPLVTSISILMIPAALIIFFKSPDWLKFRMSPYKPLSTSLRYPDSQHLITRWNSTSRIDVIDSPAVRFAPGLSLLYKGQLPQQLGISIDGGNLTAVTRSQNRKSSDLEFLSSLPSTLPYTILSHPHVLILEPKGGLDVLAADVFSAEKIKIIDNNPLLSEVIREELSQFIGELYQSESVDQVVSEGRAALKQIKEKFDLIILSLTDVYGASGTGLYGLGERYLLTIESISELIGKLKKTGIISLNLYLLPPPRQEARLLATCIEALEKNGKDPNQNIMVVRSWGTLNIFLKNSPFRRSEIDSIKHKCSDNRFDLVYYYKIKKEEINLYNKFKQPYYYNIISQLLDEDKRNKFYADYLFNVTPVTDDHPFFQNYFKLTKIRPTYKSLGSKWLPFLQGEFIVHMVLIQALIIASGLILLPVVILRKRIMQKTSYLKPWAFFSLIGLAYMFVEITLIQKFILFLGQPIYSAGLIIFSLLFSSSLGSYFSDRFIQGNVIKRLRISLLLCFGLLALTPPYLNLLFNKFGYLSLAYKAPLTMISIFPLGFLMGCPFPSACRQLKGAAAHSLPWAWASNAFASVIGSVAALLIAFMSGYSYVLWIGSGCYLLSILFFKFDS
ncbi:MAG: hypothetical protein JW755_04915 [Candidatus Aminicenantes bacterium]|nr:hypothetical protein [Candidatus Aminicenantes bacterium]